MWVTNRPVARLRGQSPILYVGETERSIEERVRKETCSNNTAGNTQDTNIRLSAIIDELKRSGHSVEVYFTDGLKFEACPADREEMLAILNVWDKRAWKAMTGNVSSAEVSIEKFVLCHYAATHLELPPMNNSM